MYFFSWVIYITLIKRNRTKDIILIYGNLKKNGELEAFAGDSYILFVKWDKNGLVTSKSIHQYGSATQNEASPHYNDQMNYVLMIALLSLLVIDTNITNKTELKK